MSVPVCQVFESLGFFSVYKLNEMWTRYCKISLNEYQVNFDQVMDRRVKYIRERDIVL